MADKTKAAHNTKSASELPGTVSYCCKQQQPCHQLIPLLRKAAVFLGFLERAVLQHPSKLLEQNLQQRTRTDPATLFWAKFKKCHLEFVVLPDLLKVFPKQLQEDLTGRFKKCPVSTGPLQPLRSWGFSCCIHEHATKNSPKNL